MKTRAAVLRNMGKDWEIIELDLDPPKEGEVLIRFTAAGLCHSDDHLRTGDIPVRYPIVGGHEGAGIVEEVGGGISRLEPGDHVVCSFLPPKTIQLPSFESPCSRSGSRARCSAAEPVRHDPAGCSSCTGRGSSSWTSWSQTATR